MTRSRTGNAGRIWTRLDTEVRQSYFRRAVSIDGVGYASAALSNSSTWEDEAADPALFAVHGTVLEAIDSPADDETVTGMTAIDGDLGIVTHRGAVFRKRSDDWVEVGEVLVPGPLTGRYTPVAHVEL